jgi:hypothetical protein
MRIGQPERGNPGRGGCDPRPQFLGRPAHPRHTHLKLWALRCGGAIRLFGQTTGNGALRHVLVDDYQAQGIGVYNVGSAETIANNFVTGVGRAAAVAQVGIEVVNGAVATTSNNTVTNNMCDAVDPQCGTDPMTQVQSVGIGVTLGAGTGTVIRQLNRTGATKGCLCGESELFE